MLGGDSHEYGCSIPESVAEGRVFFGGSYPPKIERTGVDGSVTGRLSLSSVPSGRGIVLGVLL